MNNRPIDLVDFLHDDKLGSVTPLARLLFLGLYCQADGVGVVDDRPRRLRAVALPYDSEADGDKLLDELEGAGLIRRSGWNADDSDDDESPTIEIMEFSTHWNHARHVPTSEQ